MAPDTQTQIKWGVAVCVVALLVVAIIAFVPDPLFRYRTVTTTLDNVAGIDAGTPVSFRGAVLGEVRSVELDPVSRNFRVRLNVRRDWRASACSYVSAAAANPFTPPTIEIVAIEPALAASPAQCHAAMDAQDCSPVPLLAGGTATISGCRRSPDLITAATMAVRETANVARSANQMAQRLQTMMGSKGDGANMTQVADSATRTLASLNSLSDRLDRSFKPGQGDLAVSLGNVRQFTGRIATVDVAQIDGILHNTNGVVADNRANLAVLVDQAAKSSTHANQLLEGAAASMVEASANLKRMTANLDRLSERLAADPTFAVRGQHYKDPPGLKPTREPGQ
jgi:ABC-type transporter Mla subunit MlaD